MSFKCPQCNTVNPDTEKFCDECAASLRLSKDIGVTKILDTPYEDFTRGTTFAERYQIIEEMDKGSVGKVYKVLDTEIKEKVALMLIKSEVAVNEKRILTILLFGREI